MRLHDFGFFCLPKVFSRTCMCLGVHFSLSPISEKVYSPPLHLPFVLGLTNPSATFVKHLRTCHSFLRCSFSTPVVHWLGLKSVSPRTPFARKCAQMSKRRVDLFALRVQDVRLIHDPQLFTSCTCPESGYHINSFVNTIHVAANCMTTTVGPKV